MRVISRTKPSPSPKTAGEKTPHPWPPRVTRLAAETVEGAALSLEGIDNVEGCDSLALSVLGVCDGVTDDTLEEGLENTAGLLVDHWGMLETARRRMAVMETYWQRYA
jgi:hypothetical protein